MSWTALGAGRGVTALAADGPAVVVIAGFEDGALRRLDAASGAVLDEVADAHAKAVLGVAADAASF